MKAVHFGILGPIRVHVAGSEVKVGGRQRELLAALLLRPNAIVPAEQLIELIWPGAPAAGLLHRLHTCMGRLRACLTPDAAARIVTREPGYLLRLEPGELDAEQFDSLCRECLDSARCSSWARVVDASDTALALWRGEPLLDVPALTDRTAVAGHYNEQLLHLLGARMDALINLGRHVEAATNLAGLVREHPLCERFTAQRMTALALDGRRAEALMAYQNTREKLVNVLGVEPGEDVRSLHRTILKGNVALLPSADHGRTARRGDRGPVRQATPAAAAARGYRP